MLAAITAKISAIADFKESGGGVTPSGVTPPLSSTAPQDLTYRAVPCQSWKVPLKSPGSSHFFFG